MDRGTVMKYRLEELVDLQIGRTPPRKEFEWFNTNGEGYKWVSIKDMGNSGRFISDTSEYLTEAAQKRFGIPIVEKGTLLLSFKLTVGRLCITTDRMLTNEAIAQLPIKDTNIVDRDFLYYYLKNYNFHQLGSTSSIATAINSTYLKKMEIDLPPIDQQRAIAAVLSSIDDKIESNNAINNNLEQQALALYQRLFADDLSSNWGNGTLSDLADITMGQSPSGSSYNEDGIGTIFFQGRAEFGARFPSIRLYTTEPKRMAYANDTLMSVRAPVGDLNVAHTNCCIGRGLAAIHSKNNHQSFVLYTMFSLKKQLDVFNGEGTVFGSINKDSLSAMPVIIPPSAIMDEFESIVAPMDLMIRNNYDEICRLQSIRDGLIPRLLAGEIDITDVVF